jgi:hypothetical protein
MLMVWARASGAQPLSTMTVTMTIIMSIEQDIEWHHNGTQCTITKALHPKAALAAPPHLVATYLIHHKWHGAALPAIVRFAMPHLA